MSATTTTTPQGSVKKEDHKSNRIQVSNVKQPVRFYVNLCKKMLKNGEPEVELSGLGNAIHTVVHVVEILKGQELVNTKSISTQTVEVGDGKRTKPKLQVFVTKASKFDEIIQQQEKEQEERKKTKEAQQAQQAQPTKQ